MTIELSPEVEAHIRELLRLWGWAVPTDSVAAEAVTIGALKDGLARAIALAREAQAYRDKIMGDPIPQSVPDARVFEEPCHECGGVGGIDSGGVTTLGSPIAVPCPSCSPLRQQDKPVHWADVLRDVASVPPELSAELRDTPPDIAEGTQVRTTGGRLLVWRGGQWREEGGAR